MSALKFSLLPPLSNGEIIEPGGDYFKLFKRLEKENSPWMESALSEVLVDYDRLSQFNNSGRVKESALEEDQLAYLKASTSWIIKYIRSEVDGDLVEKSREVAVEKIKNISIEKEKEIKNHYLSRDFNMSNFRGIQLKPGLRLPLYTKVKLAVSEEDRIKESPLRNVIKGFGQLLAGALSTIPDRGDAAVAARNAAQNQAIFNGISNIVKGVVLAVGGKQAGRDYEKGMEKVTTKAGTGAIGLEPYKKANEDAAAPSAPGVALQTPDTLVGDNMDTFALSGPGKKEKKKKIATKVSSFKDFLKLNK
jgi:hypothetical protein